MSGRRILRSVAGAFALLTSSLSVSPSSAQSLQVPDSQVGNSLLSNLAVGGRTLGLDSICGDCKLEKFAVCTGRVEGPTFDKDGNLWIVGLDTKDIYKVTPDGVCTSVSKTPGPNGLRFHKDGRLFGTDHAAGLFWMDTTNSNITWITNKFGESNFHGLNDLIFDKSGGLYFSDARGSGEFVKRGQLFYRTPDGVVTRLADNLSYPNGLVLSPTEDRLYVAEWGSNRIAAFSIKAPGVIDIESGWIFTYLNSGRGPDGMTMDEAGNLYAAHHSAGEVLVFNPRGFLYGAIKMPDDSMVPNNVQFHAGYL
jgi:gluconolactonase